MLEECTQSTGGGLEEEEVAIGSPYSVSFPRWILPVFLESVLEEVQTGVCSAQAEHARG